MKVLRLLPFLLLPGALAAQVPDSLRTAWRDQLVALRDNLRTVDGSLQALRRDIETAAPVTVRAKTLTLYQHCDSVRQSMADARPAFGNAPGTTRQREAATRLVRAMRALEDELRTHCLEGFGRQGQELVADSVRAWLPYRAARLRDADRAYQEAVSRFLQAMDLRLPTPSPSGP